MSIIFSKPTILSELERKPNILSCADLVDQMNQIIALPGTKTEAESGWENEDPFSQRLTSSFGFLGNFDYGKK